MAAGTPLTRLALAAASVADDLGYVALSDLARALGDIPADFRVIGGHMVTMLAARWQLGHELYRETGDVDLGITPIVARDHHVVGRLKDLDYTQLAGNRFARGLSDIPVKIKDKQDSPRPEAFIDVLVPAYTSRAHENVQVGEDLFTTEVPGLQLALARPPHAGWLVASSAGPGAVLARRGWFVAMCHIQLAAPVSRRGEMILARCSR
jgi:hypothetical protein